MEETTKNAEGSIRPSNFFVKLTYDELGTILDLMDEVELEPEEVLVREKVIRIRSLMASKRALLRSQDQGGLDKNKRPRKVVRG
jgi:hypothetical protein